MVGEIKIARPEKPFDTLTRLMGFTLLSCRRAFEFNQPVGMVWEKGEPVQIVKVVISWYVTSDIGQLIGKENGFMLIPETLFGCPVRVAEPDTMTGLQFALLNPDGTGVAVTVENKIIRVRRSAVSGNLEQIKESEDETTPDNQG